MEDTHPTHVENAAPAPHSSGTPPATPPPPVPDDEDRFLKATQETLSSTGRALSHSLDKARDIVRSPRFEPFHGVRFLQAVLNWDRRIFPARILDRILDGFGRAGHWGIVTAQVLTVFFCFAAAIKLSEWRYVGFAAGYVLLLGVFQFVAARGLDAIAPALNAAPSRLTSRAVSDSLALLAETIGLVALVLLITRARALSQWSLAWTGLGIWIAADGIAHICLNPPLLNASLDGRLRTSEEALDIVEFAARALLRAVPLVFGLTVIAANIGILAGFVPLLRDVLPEPGLASIRGALTIALLPFGAYLAYLALHLSVELLRALVRLPVRPDRPNANPESERPS